MTEGGVNILSFWGKAQPRDSDKGPRWHPLAFHCLDVAAVGDALLRGHQGLGNGLSRLLGLPRDRAFPLLVYLICLHDIGKFAKRFQAKVAPLYPACFRDDPARLAGSYDHGAGGLRLFKACDDLYRLPGGTPHRVWLPLVSAVTGHHGAPPALPSGRNTLATIHTDFGKSGVEAARAFAREVSGILTPPPDLPSLDRKCARRSSFALAGLAVLADWLGSSQDWFPYSEPGDFTSLGAYWDKAQRRADRAVAESGVLPAGAAVDLDYAALFESDAAPSPMQEWARTVDIPPGPALFLIEDETGSGKTEAALMLAQRLMAAGRAEGLYMALPTMATANAMFDRLGNASRRLFAPEPAPSVALVHGARDLHPRFRAATLRAGRAEDPYSGGEAGDGESDTTASTACAAWIADDRRRAFLADAGAGTVDQALLAVLPSRHQSLRLLGLMRRVLVLDEVHAYDAYMGREIETMLEFQAGLGGCAIVLSATLPISTREKLAAAFSRGLGEPAEADNPPERDGMAYPSARVTAARGGARAKVRARTGRARKLPVRFLRTGEEALDEVERAAGAGKAVLYIRNTVDDAFEAWEALRDRGLTPTLFHSRFALGDRLAIERRVTVAFGKKSAPGARAGSVLVATQVVEQSLDLDFDAMVTDLAPIDLLIQRAGRLWRHDRSGARRGRPELLVVGPAPAPDADESWFESVFPRAAWVYRDHARLWLTASALEKTGAIDSPDGLRPLIEAVYGDEAEARVPEPLKARFCDAKGRSGAARSAATGNLLRFGKGYVRDAGAWDSDARTPTRLDDHPRVTLRLARFRRGRIEPYARDMEPDKPAVAWRLSEVDVPRRLVSGEAAPPPEHAEAARTARADWGRFDSHKILVVLEADGHGPDAGMSGRAMSGDTAIRVTCDRRAGLRICRGSCVR